MELAVYRRFLAPVAFSLMLLTLWGVTHRFHSLSRDGELYAFQAMAKIDPSLRADLYLRNASQDDYTIFSSIYAGLIKRAGLQNAELILFVSCTLLFFAAAWKLTKSLLNANMAWLSVGMLTISVGYYGASEIFSYAEPYLTARSMAESLAVAAIALHFAGWRRSALCVAAGTMLIHPLMTLPALLLLISLWVPLGNAITGSTLVVATAFAVPVAGFLGHPLATAMDPSWFDVVLQRSHFLFLNHWNSSDWEIAARPFVCVTLTLLSLSDDRIVKLCTRVMLVGLAGLLVAYAANALSPIALLLQGQAWRWMWLTSFVCVSLLAPTALTIWRDERVGPLCATLLVLGWTCPYVDGLLCVDAALLLWLIRHRVSSRTSQHLRWTAYALLLLTAGWIIANCWSIAWGPVPFVAGEFAAVARVRELFGLGVSGVLILAPMWYCMTSRLSPKHLAAICVIFLTSATLILKGSLTQLGTIGTRGEIDQFADWRRVIPPSGTVLIIPTGKSAAFAWFTLQRPNYISVDQSAGVVFSRATALEIRRRSEVLRPLADPSWQILSHITQNRNKKNASAVPTSVPTKPLTAQSLVSICADAQLDFVIAQETLGFEAVRHEHVGPWKDWNLYDCRRLEATMPVT